MSRICSRRAMLRRTGAAIVLTTATPFAFSKERTKRPWEHGAVVGENTATSVGQQILAEGGNAVDAAVAAAFAACMAAPSRSGIGGYGGHMIMALDAGRTMAAVDFNTAAPAAATADMFPLDDKGKVKDRINFYGWRAAGVPGIPAGLALALKRYGTRSLADVLEPAIRIARQGFIIDKSLGNTLKTAEPRFATDPGSAKLYFQNGSILKAGDRFRNPDLAALLEEFARAGSVDYFYRGDAAQRIAEAFQKNGGLLTAADLATYEARDVQPSQVTTGNFTILTAPLTAPGMMILEALAALNELHKESEFSANEKVHARLEAVRLAWKDKLELYGDPEQVDVPVSKLLSPEHARELASKVASAVRARTPLDTGLAKHTDEGTNNLCIVDKHGNLVATTLTHGGSFGTQVTVPGLGLTLGHGMSRFDPHPGHPNSPGPRKRPVHNMCPSLVVRDGVPVMAIGCAGGVRIPNCIFDVVSRCVFDGTDMESAVAAPRLQCTGTLDVALEPKWPNESAQYLKSIGFKVGKWESSAVLSAVSFDPKTNECRAAVRAPAVLGIKAQP